MKTSGVRIVDEMMKFNATGNVIPAQWYKTITKENGKPNLNAIILLSDIVYWYKPTIVRNEATGEVEGLKKRFKGDMLQRTYQSFSEQFGISKRDAMNAIVALEKLGVVKRHFRSIKVETLLVNNVLFIELVPEVLFKLTFSNSQNSSEQTNFKKNGFGRQKLAIIYHNRRWVKINHFRIIKHNVFERKIMIILINKI